MGKKVVLGLFIATIAVQPLAGPVSSLPPPAPEVVPGFSIRPVAAVAAPTALAFGPGDADGPDLYAATLAGDVVRISLLWGAAGPVATDVSTFASDFGLPLGIAFRGAELYVADSHEGNESGRTDGRVSVVSNGTRSLLVDGLPNGRHNTNHLRFGPDGSLWIANGNPNDAGCTGSVCVGGDADVFPYSGAILSVNATARKDAPAILHWRDEPGAVIPPANISGHPRNADFAANVTVRGFGFRNVFGVAFSPTGLAYTAENGADSPPSQDALYRVTPGADHGFPFCFDEGLPGATGAGISVAANPLFPSADCSGVAPATALLGWHVCATGLDFARPGPAAFPGAFGTSLYVGECGPFFVDDTVAKTLSQGPSHHNTGHKVVRVVLDAAGNATGVSDFVTGLSLPTDVHFGPDGAMYIADAEGILRVAPVPLPTVPVQAVGYAFGPRSLVVPAGTTVEWRARVFPHTVTTIDEPCVPSFDAYGGCTGNDPTNSDSDPDTFRKNLPQGAAATHRFDDPGVFHYFCELHGSLGMSGEIVVV
ncbi:MAG: plastocyanin/azurin family copper-binding protein [Methanobacteriota archaeon]